MKRFIFKNKYLLFILSMLMCTFDGAYIGRHVPLIILEPMVLLAPGMRKMNAFTLSTILFFCAQVIFLIFARQETYEKNFFNKIILCTSIVYLNVCIQFLHYDSGFRFSKFKDKTLLLHELSTLPFIIISFLYLFSYVWKRKAADGEG